jgi:folylpolyglutamate synthase/dihydropteroate synthase
LDAAHNPSSITALVRYLKQRTPKRPRLLIFGTARDKKSARMLKQLSRVFDEVILTRIPNPRSQELPVLLQQARSCFRQVYPAGNVHAAMALAHALAQPKTEVVATGSFYLIGEIRKALRASQKNKRAKG